MLTSTPSSHRVSPPDILVIIATICLLPLRPGQVSTEGVTACRARNAEAFQPLEENVNIFRLELGLRESMRWDVSCRTEVVFCLQTRPILLELVQKTPLPGTQNMSASSWAGLLEWGWHMDATDSLLAVEVETWGLRFLEEITTNPWVHTAGWEQRAGAQLPLPPQTCCVAQTSPFPSLSLVPFRSRLPCPLMVHVLWGKNCLTQRCPSPPPVCNDNPSATIISSISGCANKEIFPETNSGYQLALFPSSLHWTASFVAIFSGYSGQWMCFLPCN